MFASDAYTLPRVSVSACVDMYVCFRNAWGQRGQLSRRKHMFLADRARGDGARGRS